MYAPVVTRFMGAYSLGPALERLKANRIPNYQFPERAVQSLASMYRQYLWQRRAQPTYKAFEAEPKSRFCTMKPSAVDPAYQPKKSSIT